MFKMHENFIIDQKGKRKAVILPYREYKNFLENFSDLLVIADRCKDKSVVHKDFKNAYKV